MKIIDCDESHSEAIRSILNEAIANTTAIYDYQPRTTAAMQDWFAIKRRSKFPIVGIQNDGGQLMGFASYGMFRERAGYKYTVEHSLYVATPFRNQGVGSGLLEELIQRARLQEYRVMVGGIDSLNQTSIRLHEKFGFQKTASMPQVGYKFGRWLDLHFYQLVLEGPANPVES